MEKDDFRRLVAAVSLIVVATALAIYSTPSVSPVAQRGASGALLATVGVVLTAGGLVGLLAASIGADFVWAILVGLLPPLLILVLDFVAIVVPARLEMGFILAAIPVIYCHALYVRGVAILGMPTTSDDMSLWHPWKRNVAMRVRRLLDTPQAARVVGWVDRCERRWWWPFAETLIVQVATILVGIGCAIEIGLLNSRPSLHVDVATQIWFALGAVLTLFVAPAIAILALRAKVLDRR
jgi:hypothetical protein